MVNMHTLKKNSDTLLRVDIGLALPFVAAASHNFYVILLAAAAQNLKWQSGCNCFTKLCHKKRMSLMVAPAILLLSVVAHTLLMVAPDDMRALALAVGVALLSFESFDCKLLKAVLMGTALFLPLPLAALLSCMAIGVYAAVTGWSIRVWDSSELLASNDMWLITRDARLAKRINLKGEFHLEYSDGDDIVLVGDGRLVGKGEAYNRTLPKDSFVTNPANRGAINEAILSGAVVEDNNRLVLN